MLGHVLCPYLNRYPLACPMQEQSFKRIVLVKTTGTLGRILSCNEELTLTQSVYNTIIALISSLLIKLNNISLSPPCTSTTNGVFRSLVVKVSDC